MSPKIEQMMNADRKRGKKLVLHKETIKDLRPHGLNDLTAPYPLTQTCPGSDCCEGAFPEPVEGR